MSRAGSHPSWGRIPVSAPARVVRPVTGRSPLPSQDDRPMLAYGNGRSYGDVVVNNDGTLIDTRSLDHFLAFDTDTGVLECEPGVLLADILRLVVPQGWFVPVTPGTQYVTVAGSIANDVHGKNHHVAGTFGRHVLDFDLASSDGTTRTCSPRDNVDLFAATVGGLGLTGLITRVRLQLKRVGGAFMDVDTHRFDNLRAFFELSAESEARLRIHRRLGGLQRDRLEARARLVHACQSSAGHGPAQCRPARNRGRTSRSRRRSR